MSSIRFIFGDQLSHSISSLADANPSTDPIVMCEVMSEATSVAHHQKKLVFLFSAMRHFAESLRERGFSVTYVPLDDPHNTGSFESELDRLMTALSISSVIVTEPSEYRLLSWLESLAANNPSITIRPDDRFLCSKDAFSTWAKGRKSLRMEYFYREMRQRYGILMDQGKPVGGQWNYDSENRKPPTDTLDSPPPFTVPESAITRDVKALIARHFSHHFGDIDPFFYAVTREHAQQALQAFISDRLPQFGTYQDAMVESNPWLFHSHISLYINCGLLSPMECIEAAQEAYYAHQAPLNSVEGFIRQILGWREYIRGFYWHHMPNYVDMNALSANRPLPRAYWTGDISLNCVKQCISDTKQHAYAHHIQRLMVLGNFALLIGVSPRELSDWFLSVYADAYEWVELPNVYGMALFADGGLLASKPYASSGSYINKMSTYCRQCRYSPTVKTGASACPFNYLYWDFIRRHESELGHNPRMRMIMASFRAMSPDKKATLFEDARRFLASCNDQ